MAMPSTSAARMATRVTRSASRPSSRCWISKHRCHRKFDGTQGRDEKRKRVLSRVRSRSTASRGVRGIVAGGEGLSSVDGNDALTGAFVEGIDLDLAWPAQRKNQATCKQGVWVRVPSAPPDRHRCSSTRCGARLSTAGSSAAARTRASGGVPRGVARRQLDPHAGAGADDRAVPGLPSGQASWVDQRPGQGAQARPHLARVNGWTLARRRLHQIEQALLCIS